jgi:hypothetical protein
VYQRVRTEGEAQRDVKTTPEPSLESDAEVASGG